MDRSSRVTPTTASSWKAGRRVRLVRSWVRTQHVPRGLRVHALYRAPGSVTGRSRRRPDDDPQVPLRLESARHGNSLRIDSPSAVTTPAVPSSLGEKLVTVHGV